MSKSVFETTEDNVYTMDSAKLVEHIGEKVRDYRIERSIASKGNSLVDGYQKTKISELAKYSKMLQKPACFGDEKATVLKAEIDGYLNEFNLTPTYMKRDVKPLTMDNYYKNTQQFNHYAIRK